MWDSRKQDGALGYHRASVFYMAIIMLHIAPRGWDHAGWTHAFYPDDLPPEWRLAYFCNEFDAVLVPEAVWRPLAPAQMGEWLKECGECSRFFLEGEATSGAIAAAVTALGPAHGGLVRPEAGTGEGPQGQPLAVARWDAGPADLRGLRATIEQLAGTGRDGVLVIEGAPPALEAVRAARTIAELLGLSS